MLILNFNDSFNEQFHEQIINKSKQPQKNSLKYEDKEFGQKILLKD